MPSINRQMPNATYRPHGRRTEPYRGGTELTNTGHDTQTMTHHDLYSLNCQEYSLTRYQQRQRLINQKRKGPGGMGVFQVPASTQMVWKSFCQNQKDNYYHPANIFFLYTRHKIINVRILQFIQLLFGHLRTWSYSLVIATLDRGVCKP